MTINNHLDRTELYRIRADGQRQQVELAARLQAILDKLLAIGSEVEDDNTCRVTLNLGESRGGQISVKAHVEKQY